jgi:serine/threonine protein kinase
MDTALMDPVERLRTALAHRYETDREIGRGGMESAYQARDRQHGRVVATQFLRPELAVSVEADRFLREIRIAASSSRCSWRKIHGREATLGQSPLQRPSALHVAGQDAQWVPP